jgi:WD40 repeat protein
MFDGNSMVKQWKAHSEAVMSVALSWACPNSLFTCGQDGYVKMWDIRNLDQGAIWAEVTHQRKNDEAVHCLQVNYDSTLVSGGADALVKVYGR